MKIKRAIARRKVKARQNKERKEKRELARIKNEERKALAEAKKQLEIAQARDNLRKAQAQKLAATQKARGVKGTKGGLKLLKSDAKKVMKTIMLKRLLAVFILTCLSAILPVYSNVADAQEPQPATLIINSIDAFQSVIVENDQMHIVSFDISWSSGNYTGTEAFLFRFLDAGVEIATATPYSYYNNGKSQGVVGFYFDADDPDIPTWGSANLKIELMGNPTIVWDGDVPYTSSTTWNSWSAATLLGAKIRLLALALEDDWSVDLISPVNGVNKLTSYGEDYFESSIPNLRKAAPTLFITTAASPSFPSDNHSSTHGDEVMDRWLTSGNGTFDVTDAATQLGTTRNWLMSGLWVISSITMLGLMTYGTSKTQGGQEIITRQSLRPALFLFGFMMIVGSFMGFMVMQAGLFCGIFGGIVLVFAIFWRGSP